MHCNNHIGSHSDSPLLDGAWPTLRHLAEKEIGERTIQDMETLAPEMAQRLAHELQVHQIELEMQNEELRQAQEMLEDSRAQYFDLYDLAPVGYITVSKKGVIMEANLRAATLLGMRKAKLVSQPISRFILLEDQDIYYRYRLELFASSEPQVCELRMRGRDMELFWARLEAMAAWDGKSGAPVCRITLCDITKRKQQEKDMENMCAALRREQDGHVETTESLHSRESELEKLAKALQEANAGLTALLRRRDKEKEELREQVLTNLQKLVLPSIERLKKSCLTERQQSNLHAVEANLGSLVSPLGREVLAVPASLTRMELQVANLIKQGKTTRELAKILDLSPRTVDTHRNNIRKKLRIPERHTTLQKYLLSFY